MPSKLRKLVGSRAFYAMVLAVVVPIIVQNAITNFVNLLDNLMVGRIGTDQFSGVAVANQLIYVFNLAVFGAVSGAGIFTAQYCGAGNQEGVRASCRYKLYAGLLLSLGAIALFLLKGRELVLLYLTDDSDPARVADTLHYGLQYLNLMLLGLPPFAIAQSYASTLRETGETRLPMLAGIIAVFVNLIFNYLLIYGKLGFPQLGVQGAAIATVLSRYVELGIIVIYTHSHAKQHPFARGLFRTLSIPRQVVKEITIKGMPLLVNELLWSLGMATLNQIYSLRGLDVVAATSISTTVFNLFSVFFFSMGTAASIIVGQDLGADEVEVAKDHAWKLIAFSVAISVVVGLSLISCSHAIPLLYDVLPSVRSLASQLILVCACMMPANAFCNCEYFIIRSGGKTGITFLFDCGFTWVLCIPLAYCLTHFTAMSVVLIFLCERFLDVIKGVIGLVLVKKGVWIHNIVSGKEMQVN